MLFTVLIPAYNCADHMRKTVDSIFCSGITDFEIIIVNDGSTDATGEEAEKLACKYNNITVLHQDNRGVSCARNHGLRSAKGEYLLFLDADDVIGEEEYRLPAEIVSKYKPDMLVFGMYFDWYKFGKLYQSKMLICKDEGLFSATELRPKLVELFQCNYLSPIWNKFIRREVVEAHAIQFRDEMRLLEDCKFSLDCLCQCDQVYLLPKALYHYSQDDGKKARRRIMQLPGIVEYMKYFEGLPAEYEPVLQQIFFMLLHQKVNAAKRADQLKAVSADLSGCPYKPLDQHDRKILNELKTESYRSILWRNRKRSIRHQAAVFGKLTRKILLGRAEG